MVPAMFSRFSLYGMVPVSWQNRAEKIQKKISFADVAGLAGLLIGLYTGSRKAIWYGAAICIGHHHSNGDILRWTYKILPEGEGLTYLLLRLKEGSISLFNQIPIRTRGRIGISNG